MPKRNPYDSHNDYEKRCKTNDSGLRQQLQIEVVAVQQSSWNLGDERAVEFPKIAITNSDYRRGQKHLESSGEEHQPTSRRKFVHTRQTLGVGSQNPNGDKCDNRERDERPEAYFSVLCEEPNSQQNRAPKGDQAAAALREDECYGTECKASCA